MSEPAASTELEVDPLSGRVVVVAPDRRRRPGSARRATDPQPPDELASCPFCAGHEALTPPEVFRVDGESGWIVRVIPNLFPGLDRQEVVVHSPRHVRTFADLDADEIDGVAAAWTQRRVAAYEQGFGYLHAFINEGADAGSSLPHSHSQLAWLRSPPPERARESAEALAGLLGVDELLVAEREGVRAVVNPYGRLPYETLVGAPAGELDLVAALHLVRGFVERLRALEGPVSWNAWLHEDHIDVVPRLTVLAGLELGAGIYVNTVEPHDAARALRGA